MIRFVQFFWIALLLPPSVARAQPGEPGPLTDMWASIDAVIAEWLVAPAAKVLFWDLLFFTDAAEVPFIVGWLVSGAVFFTFRFGFVNLRMFHHALSVTAGRYDHEGDAGEVSHFQALSSALSATVGLGNIAGVAVAVAAGGPGAVFWMVMAGFLGMTSKFTECTLGQMYRTVEADGHVLGGPMRYLREGLQERGLPWLGKIASPVFAVLCIGGSFGGGNMFQANQSYSQMASLFPALATPAGKGFYGVALAALVGVVIIGGIRRIGAVAGLLVPAMCGIYLLAGGYIVLSHASEVPSAIAHIVSQAFSPEAGFGGAIGVAVTGFKRAAFSNEAGIGSASIAHSAAATEEPIREGIVALLEPFIDTIIVCTMTALVVVVTGTYQDSSLSGILITSAAFASALPWFPKLLAFAAFLFAFSTMISWSYYGERCWHSLFGGGSLVYRVLFLLFVVIGSVIPLGSVLDFSDLMILGMALPNVLGLYLMSGKVADALKRYTRKLRAGEFERTVARGH